MASDSCVVDQYLDSGDPLSSHVHLVTLIKVCITNVPKDRTSEDDYNDNRSGPECD